MNNFQKLLKNGNGLGTFTSEDLRTELDKRGFISNPFPLDVFHADIKPFINCLNSTYDIPPCYIGLSLLSCYSTAIGTAYTVTTNGRDHFPLGVWAALVGLSSSGKTIALNNIYGPLYAIQSEFDFQWTEKTAGLTHDQISRCRLDTTIYRDAHIPTLVKSVLPDNPKGVVKFCDELMEWINGMNQLSQKEGTDEQFWISSWNCTSYSGIRSGKQKFVVPKPFVNVIGGTQRRLLPKLFAKDRDATGFIFRLLFALPEIYKIADPDPLLEVPKEWYEVHKRTVDRLYKDLGVNDPTSAAKVCWLTPDAVKLFHTWSKAKIKIINNIEDQDEREIRSGIYGKMKEYSLRFAAILHLVDRSFDAQYGNDFYSAFNVQEKVPSETMVRALKLADYFFTSAFDIYQIVQEATTAPQAVIIAANMLRHGKPLAEIADALYDSKENKFRMRVSRDIKKWIKEYPRVFQAFAR